MATPVFRLDAPASGSTSTTSDPPKKTKATSTCVLPADGGKSTLPRKEVPIGAIKSKPPVFAKPLAQSFLSNLERRANFDRPQSCCTFPDGSPLSAKELGGLSTGMTSTFKFGSKTLQPTSRRTELSLLDISSAYSSTLPVTVQVTSSGDSRLSLSTGTVLHVLAIKSVTVVSARSSTHNFVIPLNSSVPFSVLYNPDSNTISKKALEGHVFPNARELMKAKVLPKVVYVAETRSALRGTDVRNKATTSVASEVNHHANSIESGEILVFDQREVDREPHSCKAFSLKSKKTKSLSDDRKFSFSTCPELVSMSMTDIVQLIADQFPLKVAITGQRVAPNINPTDITLLNVTTEQSLVCFNESCRANLIDILVTEPAIKVTIDETKCSKHLCKYGAEMMQNFKLDKLIFVRDSEIQEVQTFLYSQVQTGEEMTGVKLTIPLSITEHMKSPSKTEAATTGKQIPVVEQTTLPVATELNNDASRNVHSLQPKAVINGKNGPSNSSIKNFNASREISDDKNGTFDTKEKVSELKEMKTGAVTVKGASLKPISPGATCSQSLRSDPIHIRSSTNSTTAFSTNSTPCDLIQTKDVSCNNSVCSFKVMEDDQWQQPTTEVQSDSPPLYDTFSGITVKENIQAKSSETTPLHQQLNTFTFPRVAKKFAKPPPPKPYDKLVSVKAPAVTKTSTSALQSSVTTICDADFGVSSIDKDDDIEEEIDGYSYVFMSPKDSNIKQNSSSLVCEIRNDNKQYLSSLNMEEVQSMLVANGLEQYVDVFRKERIDGGILSMLGDDDLRLELRIESRLHRLRLLRIICGDVSIKSH